MERRTTHSVVARFISSLLPPKSHDVSLLYHVPRKNSYNFETAPVEQVVLSITPSPNVYDTIDHNTSSAKGGSDKRQGTDEPRPPHTVAFLHRPFTLDRSRVRDDVLVLASHTSFDEHLTIGWNPALAERLGIDTSHGLCVRDYQGDPDRKIGTIAPVSMLLGPLLRSIEHEFGAIEHAQEGLSEEINVVAIMIAFSDKEVNRVLELAQEQGWVENAEKCGRHVLYLTGEPHKSGLKAAKHWGMTVVCVGKASAEQWGISYMASSLRTAFPDLHVREMYEDGLTDFALTDGSTDSMASTEQSE